MTPALALLVESLRGELGRAAESIVDRLLATMPAAYFHDTDRRGVMSHVKAIIAAEATGLPQEMRLRSEDGRRFTCINERSYPGQLAELVRHLPRDLPLLSASVHTARDGKLVVDVFEFGERVHHDPHSPEQADKRDRLLAAVDLDPPSAERFADYLAAATGEYLLAVTPDGAVEHFRLLDEIRGGVGTATELRPREAEQVSDLRVAVGNADPSGTFERIAHHLGHRQIDIQRAYLDTFDFGAGDTAALLTFLVRGAEGGVLDERGERWEQVRRNLACLRRLDRPGVARRVRLSNGRLRSGHQRAIRMKTSTTPHRLLLLSITLTIGSCAGTPEPAAPPVRMIEVLLTSESGHKLASMDVATFQPGSGDGTVISVYPDSTKQTIDGIGSSFTESSAFVLAHLEPERRREVMQQIYGESGANFSLTRTHIGSCDFTVEGKYSYAETPDDTELTAFSIAPDEVGFDPADYPGVKDPGYDLLPMIHEALAVKQGQRDRELRIIASAWTAPPWMKTIEAWYIPGSPENDWQGDGGWLKPEYVSTYADYLLKYLDAYKSAGVEIWGLTPVNEPHGNGGNWESMRFSPESQNDFIRQHLGPRLRESQHSDARLLIYDQNRDGLEDWTDAIFGDPRSAEHVYGAAVHWYASTFKVYEDVLDRVHARFPDCTLVHTEGCIDNLGNEAGDGIEDPIRFKESGWFNNDAFWWNPNATDWAYSATWAGPAAADHPVYTPVHRYARNIIVSLDHWVSGWVDWNIVLNREGGPNHAGNNCGAPIMIDTATQEVYYTPIYYVLAQFSRTIRPGDKAVRTERTLDGLDSDALHACATINGDALVSVQLLNTTKQAIAFKLQIADHYADVTIPANSVQTVRVQVR